MKVNHEHQNAWFEAGAPPGLKQALMKTLSILALTNHPFSMDFLWLILSTPAKC